MKGYLTLSKTSTRCSSTWNGSSYNLDTDSVKVTLPQSMRNASFSSVTFKYSASSNSGTKKIQFSDTRSTISNSSILSRLQSGSTSFTIQFSYQASSSLGGVTSIATWTNLSIEVEFVPATKVSDTLNFSGSSVFYSIKQNSLALTEQGDFSMTITPGKKITGVEVDFKTTESSQMMSYSYSLTVSAGSSTALERKIQLSTLLPRMHAANVMIRIILFASDGTSSTSGFVNTDLILVDERLAPQLSVTWTDTNTELAEAFGVFVQGHSTLRCDLISLLDVAADPDITAVSRVLTINSERYESGNGIFEIPTDKLSGDVTYSVSVTDSYGMVGMEFGTINITPYQAPTLARFEIQRYSEQVDAEGKRTPVLDDDSPTVWINAIGSVTPVENKNHWTLQVSYGDPQATRTLVERDDGMDFQYIEDQTLLPMEFSENVSWEFTVTLRDDVGGVVEYTISLPKAGAIFSIESGGVAVGQRCSATKANPAFQCAYPGYFFDGIYTGEEERLDDDTGWESLTLTNCTQYNTGNHSANIRRLWHIVSMVGQIKLNSSLANGSYVQITTLPVGMRPAQTLVIRCGGTISACDLWINSSGPVNLYNRSGSSISTSANISIACMFFV